MGTIGYPPPDLSGVPTFSGLLADYQTRNTLPNATQEDMLARVMGPITGRLMYMSTVAATETAALAIAAGVRRIPVTVNGVAVGDRVLALPNAAPPVGYAVGDAFVTAANTVSIGVTIPAIAIGTTYNLPVAIYKIT